jgi:SAM-dependent methyltransferase
MAGPAADVWASGAAYEPFVGRWSRVVAAEFLSWLAPPPGGRWLDVGCGTGALTAAILAQSAPAGVLGVDPSDGFLAYARANVADERARFEAGDAERLPVADGAVDVAVSGLVLNFVPDPGAAVAEAARTVRDGGLVGAYVWDYADGMEVLRRFWDAACALDPAAEPLHEGRRFATFRPAWLEGLFQAAGLGDASSRAIDAVASFADFDDYWSPFLGGQGPAPTYVTSLSAALRDALRDSLRASLPIRADGSIELPVRAWAVRGTQG